mgnify:CR=1 FL=1
MISLKDIEYCDKLASVISTLFYDNISSNHINDLYHNIYNDLNHYIEDTSEMCEYIARYYIKIAHIFSIITMAIYSSYNDKDSNLSYFYLTKKCYNILLAGNNTSFLLGWAPNGKEVCWLAWGWLPSFLGARARSKKRRAINKSPPRRLSGRVGLSFLCGLRAGPPAIAPHKEDKHSPATLPFNKFILSFFFFLARRAWTVLVVGYGWGPALCRGRTQSN